MINMIKSIFVLNLFNSSYILYYKHYSIGYNYIFAKTLSKIYVILFFIKRFITRNIFEI